MHPRHADAENTIKVRAAVINHIGNSIADKVESGTLSTPEVGAVNIATNHLSAGWDSLVAAHAAHSSFNYTRAARTLELADEHMQKAHLFAKGVLGESHPLTVMLGNHSATHSLGTDAYKSILGLPNDRRETNATFEDIMGNSGLKGKFD